MTWNTTGPVDTSRSTKAPLAQTIIVAKSSPPKRLKNWKSSTLTSVESGVAIILEVTGRRILQQATSRAHTQLPRVE